MLEGLLTKYRTWRRERAKAAAEKLLAELLRASLNDVDQEFEIRSTKGLKLPTVRVSLNVRVDESDE